MSNPRYTDCQLKNEQTAPWASVQINRNGNIITSISENTCPDYYQIADVGFNVVSNVCQSEIDEVIKSNQKPDYIHIKKIGVSKPHLINFRETYDYQMTPSEIKADIARKYGVSADNVTIAKEEITTVKNQCVTQMKFTGQGDKTRLQDAFKESTCTEQNVAPSKYEPTPETFLKLKNQLRPNNRIYWHSIANQDGKHCPNQTKGDASQGTDYFTLSKETDGIIENVCGPKFDGFMKKLSNKVLDTFKLRYDLNGYDSARIVRVHSQTRNIDLSANIDYSIDGNTIVFTNGAVVVNELIDISFSPVSGQNLGITQNCIDP